MTISSAKIRKILENALDRLDEIDDCGDKPVNIKAVTNTYFLGDCWAFLGLSGYDGGYVNLDRIEEDEETWEEEE
jgi:hypothetical protein